MAPKRYRLKNLVIHRVDLVDRGANYDPKTGDGAHILLAKRAPSSITAEPAMSVPDRTDRERALAELHADAARLGGEDVALSAPEAFARAAAARPDLYERYARGVAKGERERRPGETSLPSGDAAVIGPWLAEKVVRRYAPATFAVFKRAEALVAEGKAPSRPQAVATVAGAEPLMYEAYVAERRLLKATSDARRKLAERLASLTAAAQIHVIQDVVREEPQLFLDLLREVDEM